MTHDLQLPADRDLQQLIHCRQMIAGYEKAISLWTKERNRTMERMMRNYRQGIMGYHDLGPAAIAPAAGLSVRQVHELCPTALVRATIRGQVTVDELLRSADPGDATAAAPPATRPAAPAG